MDRRIFDAMAEVEQRHWWFRARRRIISDVIAGLHLPATSKILEAGAGSGGNLAMLARFGAVSAFERDDQARQAAAARGIGRVAGGSLPDEVPFGTDRFDLIVMLDVLEHLQDDRACLAALTARLAPRGRVLLTVPARPDLWSQHDVVHHHMRRYTQPELEETIIGAGLRVRQISHFNSLLFPLVAAGRAIGRIRRTQESVGLKLPRGPVNALLESVFASERKLLARMSLPVGVSLLAVAEAG